MTKNPNSKIILALAVVILVFPLVYKYGIQFINHDFIDFPSFYYGSKATFTMQVSPYDYEKLMDLFGDKEKIFPFLYPPPTLLLFYPLSILDYYQAKALMLFLSHVSFLLSLYIVLFKILKLRADDILLYLLLIYSFAFQPMYLTLALGQVNLILLALICLFWYFFERDEKSYITAIPITLAILLKTYPVLFLLYFLIKKKYSLFYWTSGFLIIVAVLSFVILPNGSWADWITNVLPSGGFGEVPYNLFNPAAPWNLSINGFVSRIFFPNSFNDVLVSSILATKVIGYLLLFAVLGVTFGAIWKAGNRAQYDPSGKEICLILLASYLIAPLSWEHHLVFLMPCIFVLYKDLFTRKFNIFSLFLVGFSLILARDIPVESVLFKRGIWVLVISTKFYGVVALWCYFLWSILDNRSEKGHRFAYTKPHVI